MASEEKEKTGDLRAKTVVSPKLFGFSKKFSEGLEEIALCQREKKSKATQNKNFLVRHGGDAFRPIASVDPVVAEKSKPPLFHLSGKMVDVHHLSQKGQYQRAYMQQLQEMTSTRFFQNVNEAYKHNFTPLNLQKLLDTQQKQMEQSEFEEPNRMSPNKSNSPSFYRQDHQQTNILIPTSSTSAVLDNHASEISFQDSLVSETDSMLLDQLRSQAEQVYSVHVMEQSIAEQEVDEEEIPPSFLSEEFFVALQNSISQDNYSIMTPQLDAIQPLDQTQSVIEMQTSSERENTRNSPTASLSNSPRQPIQLHSTRNSNSPTNYFQQNNQQNHHRKYEDLMILTGHASPSNPSKPAWRSYTKHFYRKQNFIYKRSPAAVAAYYEKHRQMNDAEWKEKALKFLLQDNDDELNTQDIIRRELMEDMRIFFDKEQDKITEDRYHFETRFPTFVEHIAEPMKTEGNEELDVVHAMIRGKLNGAETVVVGSERECGKIDDQRDNMQHIHELLSVTNRRKHRPEPQILDDVPEIVDGPVHYTLPDLHTSYIPPCILEQMAAEKEKANEISAAEVTVTQTATASGRQEPTIPASSSTTLLLQEANEYLHQRMEEKRRSPDWNVYEPFYHMKDTTLASLISFNYHQTMKELPGFASYPSPSSSVGISPAPPSHRSPRKESHFSGKRNTTAQSNRLSSKSDKVSSPSSSLSATSPSLIQSPRSMKITKGSPLPPFGGSDMHASYDYDDVEGENEFRMYSMPSQPQNQSLSSSAFASPRRKKHLKS